jgi:predicted P-loop ATPase
MYHIHANKIDHIEFLLNQNYNFKYNLVTGRCEFKKVDSLHYIPLTDLELNSILRFIHKANVKCNLQELRNIIFSDFSPKYNPFEDYFYNLDEWDKTNDYITKLAETISTTNQEVWKKYFKKWIVGMVACVLDEKITNHTLIVFSGKQGIGKTTWILNLIPTSIKEYTYSGTINPDNKDTLIHLSECMLINLDELENFNRTEVGSLKEIITKDRIRIRRPYGSISENLVRRASFIGSVNTTQFLNDTTGSRRFLCFEVLAIDYLSKIDLGKVYSQALELYKSGFKFWFDEIEVQELSENNEKYQIKYLEEELLLEWFDIIDSNSENEDNFMTTTQILNVLGQKSKISVNNLSINKLGRALSKHEFKRVVRSKKYVYAIKLKANKS